MKREGNLPVSSTTHYSLLPSLSLSPLVLCTRTEEKRELILVAEEIDEIILFTLSNLILRSVHLP